jgi:uncharacterized membrane protein
MKKQSSNKREAHKELPIAITLPILAVAIAGTAAVHYYLLTPSGAQTANPKRMGQLYLIILSIIFFALYLPVKLIYNLFPNKRNLSPRDELWWDEND